MVDVNFRPNDRTLRDFGFVALGGFGMLSVLAHFEWFVFSMGLGEAREVVVVALLATGLLAAVFSVAYARANLPLYLVLTVVAYPIGLVLSTVILVSLFVLLVVPFGLALRLVGHDPLSRRIDRGAKSYWSGAVSKRPKWRYFKQF